MLFHVSYDVRVLLRLFKKVDTNIDSESREN